jgi:beta-phosphoglucomutase-like phosphatase (HAD superfamily)
VLRVGGEDPPGVAVAAIGVAVDRSCHARYTGRTVIATLFDFNGVLVDDEAVHLAAFRDVLLPLGIVTDDATYAERYLGFDDAGAFRAILEDAGRAALDAVVAGLIEAKKLSGALKDEIELGLRALEARGHSACDRAGVVGGVR